MNPKNSDEMAIMLASGPQCATLAQMVALALTKKFDGKLAFSQAQIAITDKNQFAVDLLAEKFVKEIFSISIDPWTEEKKKISLFYKVSHPYRIFCCTYTNSPVSIHKHGASRQSDPKNHIKHASGNPMQQSKVALTPELG